MTLARSVRGAWAATLGLERGSFADAAGVTVVVDPPALDRVGFVGHLVFLLGDACVVTTSAEREGVVRDTLDGKTPFEAFDPGVVASLAIEGWVVLGPSLHAYVDRSTFTPVDGDHIARRVGPEDAAAIERLSTAVGPDDWAEGGFGHDAEVLWGIEQDDELVAMGNMTDFDGRPADVGLATHPAHRGRGLGTALASAMTRAAFEDVDVVRYRALETNASSLRVAARLGFVPYGSNYAVRPPR